MPFDALLSPASPDYSVYLYSIAWLTCLSFSLSVYIYNIHTHTCGAIIGRTHATFPPSRAVGGARNEALSRVRPRVSSFCAEAEEEEGFSGAVGANDEERERKGGIDLRTLMNGAREGERERERRRAREAK